VLTRFATALATVTAVFLVASSAASAGIVLEGDGPVKASGPGARVSNTLFPEWRRWPSHVVRYHNDVRAIGDAVRKGARAWSSTGARIRWKAVPRKRAQVVIRKVEMKHLSGWAGPDRSSTPDGTRPPTGSVHGSVIKIDPSVVVLARNRPVEGLESPERISAGQVVAHEMGHILGLAHEEKRCAIMNSPLIAHCPVPEVPGTVRCGLLEPDDLRGLIRLFGGRIEKTPEPAFCRVETAPRPVEDFSVSIVRHDPLFNDRMSLHHSWRLPARDLPAKVTLKWGADGEPCPASPGEGTGTARPSFAVGTRVPGARVSGIFLQNFSPGTYCFSLFSIGRYRTPGDTYATAVATVPPPE